MQMLVVFHLLGLGVSPHCECPIRYDLRSSVLQIEVIEAPLYDHHSAVGPMQHAQYLLLVSWVKGISGSNSSFTSCTSMASMAGS